MTRGLTVAVTAVVAALSASACGGQSQDPRAVSAPPGEVVDVLDDFRNALASRDFGRICDVLLAAEARRQAGGKECPAMLKRTAAGVTDPTIKLESLSIRGDFVTAGVTTTAAGQAPVADTMEFVRERGRFRILAPSR